ncbi:serine/threonine kinase 31 [Hypomesus transpacificus]|uniref:serine/threonine kinase 31 n=1 Tax=Hypomesus transpacificus TaxID=137520 RepID=UPI001F07B699|nr:serine/threonine kinase 31 [Hypomesus transpacificus]
MDQTNMDREKMELVGVTHVLDAITFWAQNVNEDQAIEAMSNILAQKCPEYQRLFGTPIPQKIYGAMFSEDSCWYRCKVQQQIDDKVHVSYIDYGNSEVVSRSAVVELPVDLQSPSLAKKYKFWGFHVSSDHDSQHFKQGKAFLQNLILGKKVRIQKKSVCFDGTILVQAFQGNLDIGEELMRMKFAKQSLPGSNQESSMSRPSLQDSPALLAHMLLERGQGEGDVSASPVCMPKLRPVLSDQIPQSLKEKNTVAAPVDSIKINMELDVLVENEKLKAEHDAQQQITQQKEKELSDTRSELQRLKEENLRETEKCKAEKDLLRGKSEELEKHLRVANFQLESVREEMQRKEKEMDKLVDSAVSEQFCRLAEKVNSLRGLRERSPGLTDSDSLMESISTVINDSISAPVTMGKLATARHDYMQAQEKLRECKTMEQLGDLIPNRNKVRSVLTATVEAFLEETKSLPVRKRLEKLEEVSMSLATVFGPFSPEEVDEHAFEQYYQWKTQTRQQSSSVRDETDKALSALCTWSENIGKFFCLSNKTSVSVTDLIGGISEVLKQAEQHVSKEMDVYKSEPNNQNNRVVTNAFHKVMQHIQEEKKVLNDLMEKYLTNTKGEVLEWQTASPTPDTLFSTKKRIRTLRSQLRWRQVEESSLEECEELDLTEILKKKEEIAETRKDLFQEIAREKEEYTKLSALVEDGFPELPLLYPETDIHSFMSSGGLLVSSLDKDMFDAEPMRELSHHRPLVHTEFQGQRVILKSYTVNEEVEGRVLERTAQFHRARTQGEAVAGLLPLLALFFSKSDPLAYVMVPYFPNGSLKAVQTACPMSTSEVCKVMKGVAQGLERLHAVGITHASLNPSNVFVLNRQQGMVGDFDFTKTPEQRAVSRGMVAGSVSLVAPELRQGSAPPSPASDMFSFGCLLLWLHVPDFNGALNTLDELKLVPKLQALLSKLLAYERRLTAAEVLADHCFQSD